MHHGHNCFPPLGAHIAFFMPQSAAPAPTGTSASIVVKINPLLVLMRNLGLYASYCNGNAISIQDIFLNRCVAVRAKADGCAAQKRTARVPRKSGLIIGKTLKEKGEGREMPAPLGGRPPCAEQKWTKRAPPCRLSAHEKTNREPFVRPARPRRARAPV